jgi:GTPase SAR1 family protein
MDPLTLSIVSGIIGGVGAGAILYAMGHGPKFMKWASRKLAGTRIGIAGPPDAGKTSFINYLRFGEYADEHPTVKTTRRSPAYSFDVDSGGELQLSVQQTFDVPGEFTPHEQVRLARKTGPDALLIFVGIDSPHDFEWLSEYLEQLSLALQRKWSIIQRVRSIIVILNKSDLIASKDKAKAIAQAQAIVQNKLGGVLLNNISRVAIVPCTLFRSQGGARAARAVLLALLHSLRRKTALIPLRGR